MCLLNFADVLHGVYCSGKILLWFSGGMAGDGFVVKTNRCFEMAGEWHFTWIWWIIICLF